MGSEEKELADLLRIKRKRLAVLNKQIAQLGYSAPPHLITERDDLQAELDKDKPVLEPIIKGEVSDDTMAALRSWGVPGAVSNAIMLLEQGLNDFKKEFHRYRDQRYRDSERDAIERRERQEQHDAQMQAMREQIGGITRLQWIIVVVVAVAVTYLLARG